jgi:hypothetical protein
MKIGQFKYIDSMQFMNSSLANLAKNLDTDRPITKYHFTEYTSEQIDLVCRKGVYPYEYINSHKRFKETEFSPIYKFHSILGGKITQADYMHAQKVWQEFGCKDLDEYHDLYLKTDILILADVWINSIKLLCITMALTLIITSLLQHFLEMPCLK